MFLKAEVLSMVAVGDARVSALQPLKIGDFGLVYTPKCIMIGQGKLQCLCLSTDIGYSLTFYHLASQGPSNLIFT